MKRLILYILCAVLCCSCHKTMPQSPSNKVEKTDTIGQALMELNFRLSEEADREITAYVKAASVAYAQHELGFWYRKLNQTEGRRYTHGNVVDLQLQFYTLDGKKLLDSEETICIGKRETAWCIDWALELTNEGEALEIISPWYAAFGPTGNDFVPAYTNVKIIVQTTK